MVAIIIVGFKNDDLTISFVKNELKKVQTEHITILVNNSSTNASNLHLKSSLDGVVVRSQDEEIDTSKLFYVIDSPDNLGFAKANNLGAQFVKNHFPQCEYFLFSNNDIRIVDAHVVEKMIEVLNSDSRIGIITPNIIGIDGKRQTPQKQVGIVSYSFKLLFGMITRGVLSKYQKSYAETADSGFHYSFSECFFMTRTEDYMNCGMMDPHTFLYAEGLCLSERMLRINKQYFFEPSVSVIHENGTTTRKSINNTRMTKLMMESNAHYFKTYTNCSSISLALYSCLCNFRIWLSKIRNK